MQINYTKKQKQKEKTQAVNFECNYSVWFATEAQRHRENVKRFKNGLHTLCQK